MSVPPGATSRAPARSGPDATGSAPPAATWPSGVVLGVLCVLVGVGVVLRFVTTSPLWLDEALSVNISRLPVGDIPEALRHDGHPPAAAPAAPRMDRAVRQRRRGPLRALAGLFSVLSLPLAWLVGRRVGGRELAWTMLVVVALSPYALAYSTSARMYTLVALIVLAGFLVVDDALRSPEPWRLGVIALLSGTLVLTHYWGFWFIAAVLCVIGWQAFRASDADHRNGGTAGRPGDLCRRPPVPALVTQLPRPGSSHRHPVGRAPATGLDRGHHAHQLRRWRLPGGVLFGAVILALFLLGLLKRGADERHIDLDLATRPQVRPRRSSPGSRW